MEWQSKREEDVEPVDGIEESQRDPGTGISVSVFHSQSGSGECDAGVGGGAATGGWGSDGRGNMGDCESYRISQNVIFT